ncbi:hypothetical protein [Kitasatospora cathayae]|uniref:Uncharacterized protein n=1 Tax=Kitasatospora cathayae TaxID=3004092 RepID=A0ABY7QH54_9ACTN|nr:hypothetical protein [Kitasatospora sp. HUAS 3-15]WBP92159.1 hypothetical protein O1G21_41165 [Kitasatospora sp. HUAS 3-15]
MSTEGVPGMQVSQAGEIAERIIQGLGWQDATVQMGHLHYQRRITHLPSGLWIGIDAPYRRATLVAGRIGPDGTYADPAPDCVPVGPIDGGDTEALLGTVRELLRTLP